MKAIVWIRRDIRVHDHAALSHALKECDDVLALFIYDTDITDKLRLKKEYRLHFIHQALQDCEKKLQDQGSSLKLAKGSPLDVFEKLLKTEKVQRLYFNRDYEVYAKKRDKKIIDLCERLGVEVFTFKDSVFREQNEIRTNSNTVFKVFTPYARKWMESLGEQDNQVPNYTMNWSSIRQWKNAENALEVFWPEEKLGFTPCPPVLTGGATNAKRRLREFQQSAMKDYEKARNFPAEEGTSNLSVYIRHGNLSIREMIRSALEEGSSGAKAWLNELIWRDFYQTILDTHPQVEKNAFRAEYDTIEWQGGKKELDAWKSGQTGFPIVDAAMRGLNQTGQIHNRLRMVVASFLCKTLLVDWRKGERYFAERLLDFDLAANNGGWQWAASTGTDAQPYFRIFNPTSQSERYDPEGHFIRRYVPELASLKGKSIHCPSAAKEKDLRESKITLGEHYPYPVVDYKKNRQRALEMYKAVKG